MRKIKLNKGVITQEQNGKITIFDGEKSLLFSFNESATFIFKQIKKGKSIEKILDLIIIKYGISKEEAYKDIEEFLKELKSKKIITK